MKRLCSRNSLIVIKNHGRKVATRFTDLNFMEENHRNYIYKDSLLISDPVKQLLKKEFKATLKLDHVHRNLLRFSTVLHDETLSLVDKIPWTLKPTELIAEIFVFKTNKPLTRQISAWEEKNRG